jgi:vancomycin resistance protein YoaR
MPGVDATVYAPSVDFRFMNDTDYHVLILTTYQADDYRLIIDFYSTDVGRKVELTDPVVYNLVSAPAPVYFNMPDKPADYLKQVDWAAPGCDTEFQRIITFTDGSVKEETYISHFKAWSAKYERGTQGAETDTEGQEESSNSEETNSE